MKTIGLLGGMSWESSLEYYRIINETVKQRLGDFHSAQSLMYSFDFAEIEQQQVAGDWDAATEMMIGAAQQLERGGADFLVICTGTMHKMADKMQQQLDIPILHIADATAAKIKAAGLTRIALLGTRFTMEHDFFKDRLRGHDLEVIVPDKVDRDTVHRVIYDELVVGTIEDNSRRRYQDIIERLHENGAQGVILGCTEIGLLIQPEHSIIPTFDITHIHAVAAVEYALGYETIKTS